MKKLFCAVRKQCNMVNLLNLCAMGLVISSVNAACFWAHHQPEVPEDAKRFRKF